MIILPFAARILCRVAEPSVLVADHGAHKPSVAGRAEHCTWSHDPPCSAGSCCLVTCSRCSSRPRPVCRPGGHCSCPPCGTRRARPPGVSSLFLQILAQLCSPLDNGGVNFWRNIKYYTSNDHCVLVMVGLNFTLFMSI